MMEKTILVQQRFSYATIRAFKDFSLLSDRDKNNESPSTDFYNFSFTGSTRNFVFNNRHIELPIRAGVKKKNTFYFYSSANENDYNNCVVEVKPYSRGQVFYTQNDKHIKNHFNKPFTSIDLNLIDRSVYIKNNKLTIKLFIYRKSREINSKYFKKYHISKGLTIDLKTGDIISFSSDKTQKKIRKNYFHHIIELVESDLFITGIRFEKDFYSKFPHYEQIISNDEILESVHTALKKLSNFNPYNVKFELADNTTKKYWVIKNLVNFFVKCKDIKVPNEFLHYIVLHYPTKKILQKNDNKLIASILDKHNLKSKYLIKILHKFPRMDINFLFSLSNYFGKEHFHKYVSNINLSLVPTFPIDPFTKHIHYHIYNYNDYELNDSEKSNLVKLFNEFTESHINNYPQDESYVRVLNAQIGQLNDHFNMIKKLKKYIPTIALRANTWKTFSQEHLLLSAQVSKINKGYTTEIVYLNEMCQCVEAPIIIEDNKYYPVILKRDIDYTIEGNYMHHCVGTYSENLNSLIISLRTNSTESNNRITIEFNTNTRSMIQARSFCNSNPPEHFIEPLEVLKERILDSKNWIKPTEIIRKELDPDYFIDIVNSAPNWVNQELPI